MNSTSLFLIYILTIHFISHISLVLLKEAIVFQLRFCSTICDLEGFRCTARFLCLQKGTVTVTVDQLVRPVFCLNPTFLNWMNTWVYSIEMLTGTVGNEVIFQFYNAYYQLQLFKGWLLVDLHSVRGSRYRIQTYIPILVGDLLFSSPNVCTLVLNETVHWQILGSREIRIDTY